jgi:hypothetical protein
LGGEMVVDLWGGWADEARTLPRLKRPRCFIFPQENQSVRLT